ncbi:MAG: hypothetical protein KF861_00690 [Planctomycetaceae bacterium]|nr:hypothetical protein [Planctomycetaceae bacterium]
MSPRTTRMFLRLPPWIAVGLLGSLSVVLNGCTEQDAVARYAVPKEVVPEAPASTASPAVPATRKTAWFFKVEGPPAMLDEIQAPFTSLVESVRFAGGKPQWSLPEGWSAEPGAEMRFATLKTGPTESPLEVSVIPLPVFGEDFREYLRQNVNRWRGQLGLDPMSGNDWFGAAHGAGEINIKQAGDIPLVFVDLRGKTGKYDPARMLGAILVPDLESPAASSSTERHSASASQPESAAAATPAFTPSDGWLPGKASAMRVASFLATEGDRQVDISVIAASGDELENVNRWRGQIGLPPVAQSDLDATVQELDVHGTTARMFELVGDSQTILAAILPGNDRTWFFKLMGDPALAAREKAAFEAFVESAQLP